MYETRNETTNLVRTLVVAASGSRSFGRATSLTCGRLARRDCRKMTASWTTCSHQHNAVGRNSCSNSS